MTPLAITQVGPELARVAHLFERGRCARLTQGPPRGVDRGLALRQPLEEGVLADHRDEVRVPVLDQLALGRFQRLDGSLECAVRGLAACGQLLAFEQRQELTLDVGIGPGDADARGRLADAVAVPLAALVVVVAASAVRDRASACSRSRRSGRSRRAGRRRRIRGRGARPPQRSARPRTRRG